MPTLYEYFHKDQGRTLLLSKSDIGIRNIDSGEYIDIKARIHIDHEPNALYVAFFVPKCTNLGSPEVKILEQVDTVLSWVKDVRCEMRFLGRETLSSADCQFTGRVYMYTENSLDNETRAELERVGAERGLSIIVRDPEYAIARTETEIPLAFISHDSRNKAEFAEPLALALQRRMCTVWYDGYSLRVGDSLRESIEQGLKTCRKCVFILTKEFLANGGWAKREYDSIFTRELVEESNVILPVWAGVERREVYEYSPILADRVATKWPIERSSEDAGQVVAAELHNAIIR